MMEKVNETIEEVKVEESYEELVMYRRVAEEVGRKSKTQGIILGVTTAVSVQSVATIIGMLIFMK